MNRDKLKNLISKLSSLEENLTLDPEMRSLASGILDEQFSIISKQVKESSVVKYLDQINKRLGTLKKDFNLAPVIESITEIQDEIDQIKQAVGQELNKSKQQNQFQFDQITNLVGKNRKDLEGLTNKEVQNLLEKIDALQDGLTYQSDNSKQTSQSLKDVMANFETKLANYSTKFSSFMVENQNKHTNTEARFKDAERISEDFKESLKKLRIDVMSRISYAGGNANRNIAINSNTSVLGKYTDINIKPGNNVTLSYTNNETTKYLDLTIAATGGSGSTRSINSINTSQTAGNTSGTDYVYVATQGILVTLPTAVGNTNLYTIKNASNSSVLVATTGGQTIDEGSEALLSIKYTSVDLISDNANWQVT